jgi:hypothetical protein
MKRHRIATAGRIVAISACLTMVGATTASSPPPAATLGMSFAIRITFRHQPPSGRQQRAGTLLGHGIVAGGRGRVDIDSTGPGPLRKGDFIIMQDSVNSLWVRPSDTTVRKRNSPFQNPLEGITEKLLDPANSATALKVDFDTVSMNEPVNGYPTRHYRIQAEGSFLAGTRQVRQEVTVEQWVAKVPMRIMNPFGARIHGLPEVMLTKSDYREFINTLAMANRVFGDAVALKTVTTTSFTYGPGLGEDFYATVDVTDLKPVDVDERQFMLPMEYMRKKPPGK